MPKRKIKASIKKRAIKNKNKREEKKIRFKRNQFGRVTAFA